MCILKFIISTTILKVSRSIVIIFHDNHTKGTFIRITFCITQTNQWSFICLTLWSVLLFEKRTSQALLYTHDYQMYRNGYLQHNIIKTKSFHIKNSVNIKFHSLITWRFGNNYLHSNYSILSVPHSKLFTAAYTLNFQFVSYLSIGTFM